jgi:phage gp45-like
LNKVVVGRGHKLTQDDTSLTAPPTGYDSVLAEIGGSLNHDELVVYTNDAIRPSFLVIYGA